MTPTIPLPWRGIPWVVAFAAAACFAVALLWPHHGPDSHALAVAHDSTVHAVAHMDSARKEAKVAHAVSNLRVKQLAPLRERITITPNAVLVDGRDTLSGPSVGVVAKVLAADDSTISALEATVAAQDTALVADSLALMAARHETDVARALIPSRWQRVQTAARWSVIGGAVALVAHAVLR